MLAHLTGTVTQAGATHVVLDLGGFGIRALCTPATAASVRPNQQATLHTSLVVREDSLTVYGFVSEDERDTFELVQSVSGVGPRLAQAIVSVLGPDDLKAAIAQENLVALTKVPGVGRKGAQRLVIELKDKVHAIGTPETPEPATSDAPQLWREQVMDGLQGLGWSARDAEQACDGVQHLVEADPTVGVAVLMRAALASLARK